MPLAEQAFWWEGAGGGRVSDCEIGTWRLSRTGRAKRVNIVEEG